jgi:serine/threonine protein kinase/Tol biopolymer transport system component
MTPGTRIGPYEVLAPLGAGGMGEVWKARDTRLGREVAIKLLPEALASDRDRLSRFEQEARSASALNHPNIITIYEIGSIDSVSYIAMELVQGRTLRDLIVEGPLPARRLLALAAQIADALARAHEAGIIHRDLKPENLMATRDGLVKVLDFGLAKLALPESGEVSAMPTLAQPETQPGVVLGTVGYMSPEQASGKPVDFRSDQFSFGSILYEMATGKRAFSRGTTAETLVAIIREEPEPLGSLVPRAPAAVRWVIERCLAKDPEERYASTRDLARDLTHLRDHVSEVSAEAAPVILARRLGWLGPALIAGLLLAAALAVFAALRPRHQPPAQPIRFAVSIPPGTTYAPSEVSRGFSISPDGTRLVIEALSKGRRRLFVRPLDSEEAVELEGSLDATSHFWSPDSRFIAFYADGKLKKIPAAGGRPQELCDAPFAIVGTWNREGTVLFSRLDPPGIYRVADTGGESVRILSPEPSRREVNLIWPYFLPDGRRFLYFANQASGTGNRELRVASLDSKETRSVGRVESRVEYAAPGYLLHVRESALFAQSFDDRKAEFRGEPRLLVPSIHYFFGPSFSSFSASRAGVLAYQTAARSSRLAWFDREGKEKGQLGEPSVVKGLRISPDGGQAAVDIENPKTGSSDIWGFDLNRGVSTRFHSDPVDEAMPVWSADGSKVVYRSDRKGPPDIYEIAIGVPGSERPLYEAPGLQQPEDTSRDGRSLAYLQEVASTVWNIWLLPLQGERKPVPWRRTRFNETSPRFSPDGRWIAYESDESGDPEIYLALSEGGGEKRRISPGGGRRPRWRRDGKELYYLAPGNSVMAVSVTPGTRLETGAPAALFHVETEIENYDVTPDGSRFLIKMPSEKSPAAALRVIVNWPAAVGKER